MENQVSRYGDEQINLTRDDIWDSQSLRLDGNESPMKYLD